MARTFADYLNGDFEPPSSQLGGLTPLQQLQQRLASMGRYATGGALMNNIGNNAFMGTRINEMVARPAAAGAGMSRPSGRPMATRPLLARTQPAAGGMSNALASLGGIPAAPQPFNTVRMDQLGQRDMRGQNFNGFNGLPPVGMTPAFPRGGRRRPPAGYNGPLPTDGGYGNEPVFPIFGGLRPRLR